jgi:hypothetical protein
MSCGYGPYVDLMQQYPLVTDAFLCLKPMYQQVPPPQTCTRHSRTAPSIVADAEHLLLWRNLW